MKALLLCACMLVCHSLAADQSPIHRMMMDGKILQLAETQQLTDLADGEVDSASISPDGKYVAFADFQASVRGEKRLCLIRATGGQPAVIMSRPTASEKDDFVGDIWDPRVMSEGQIAWSPDSSMFAFPTSHVVLGEKPSPFEYGIAVYRSTGALRTYAQFKGFADALGPFRWSPDGSKLASTFVIADRDLRKGTKPTQQLLALDVSTGSLQTLVSRETRDIKLESWRADGKAIRYTISEGGKTQLREVTLDGTNDEVIQGDYSAAMNSPDGVLQTVAGPGISIRNVLTGQVTEVMKSLDGKVLGWAPNNKMLVYQRPMVVKDETGKRQRTLNMLWLAAVEANPINHVCAALDSQEGQPPTWSKDCMKMAYVSEGRVYVAEFAWKPLAMDDKLAAGLPLTEEEEKDFLTANAKQLGAAMNMYASDNDDKYPSADTYMQDVLVYSRNERLFNRPGTNQPIFQYFPPGSEPNLANSASTMIGMFDVGYGWKVVIYADGHAKVVPK